MKSTDALYPKCDNRDLLEMCRKLLLLLCNCTHAFKVSTERRANIDNREMCVKTS